MGILILKLFTAEPLCSGSAVKLRKDLNSIFSCYVTRRNWLRYCYTYDLGWLHSFGNHVSML
jgi:hypothetical protein